MKSRPRRSPLPASRQLQAPSLKRGTQQPQSMYSVQSTPYAIISTLRCIKNPPKRMQIGYGPFRCRRIQLWAHGPPFEQFSSEGQLNAPMRWEYDNPIVYRLSANLQLISELFPMGIWLSDIARLSFSSSSSTYIRSGIFQLLHFSTLSLSVEKLWAWSLA